MTNTVVLQGVLATNPIVSEFSNNSVSAKFVVAADISLQNCSQASFIPVVAYGETAKFVYENLKKGSLINVKGKFQQCSYINKNGKKNSITEIIASEICSCKNKLKPADYNSLPF